MIGKTCAIAAAALLLCTTAAPAANKAAQNEAAQEVPTAGKGAGEKKVCKRMTTSGTRLGERLCLSKAEWKKLEALD